MNHLEYQQAYLKCDVALQFWLEKLQISEREHYDFIMGVAPISRHLEQDIAELKLYLRVL